MIRSDTIVLSGHHTQLNARYDEGSSVHGPKVSVQKDRRSVRLPLSRILLDSFKGIHDGKDFPIFLDGNSDNLSLDNLIHGTEETYREAFQDLLNTTNGAETFEYVIHASSGQRSSYLTSTLGRLYSFVTSRFITGSHGRSPTPELILEGVHYNMKMLVWTTFNGPIPDSHSIKLKSMEEPIDLSLSNLECIPTRDYRNRIRASERVLNDELQNSTPTQANLESELWTNNQSSQDAPNELEVSNYGRIKKK
jgi:hypothetical protein